MNAERADSLDEFRVELGQMTDHALALSLERAHTAYKRQKTYVSELIYWRITTRPERLARGEEDLTDYAQRYRLCFEEQARRVKVDRLARAASDR
jgi:hypothetical protein